MIFWRGTKPEQMCSAKGKLTWHEDRTWIRKDNGKEEIVDDVSENCILLIIGVSSWEEFGKVHLKSMSDIDVYL